MHNADRDPASGCLVSRYSVGSHGYAQIGWTESGRTRMMLAHRAVWIHAHGPIPDGMTVDHRQGKCHHKCIELGHLRLITNHANARRNTGQDFPMGQCQHGHPDSALKLYSRGGGKKSLGCSICRSDMQKRYRRNQAARAAATREI